MTWKSLLLSVIPGLSHVHCGRGGRGILWFVLFALALNLFLTAPFLVASKGLRIGAGIASAALWILALVDGVRCAARAEAIHRESRKDPSYEETRVRNPQ